MTRRRNAPDGAVRFGGSRALLLGGVLVLAAMLTAASNPALLQAAEYQLGERVLSRGSWGADVFRLQQRLAEAGYDLTIDGHFGTETERVVTAFQLAHGLEPDGIAGAETLSILTAVLPTFVYTVRPGDSLWAIARRFETTMEQLVALNDLPEGPLRVGEKLRVPRVPSYTVRPGDTLWEIAERFHTKVEAIARLNGITEPDLVRVGTKLRLPRGSQPTFPGF